MDSLAIPDLINVVSTELPLDTTTSFTEAEVVKRNISSRIYDVPKLCSVSFLTSTGGQANIPAYIDNKDRTKDIVFIRFSYTIDAHNIDNRVH